MKRPRFRYPRRISFGLFFLGSLIALNATAGSSCAQDYVYTNPAADSYVLTMDHISLSTNVTVDDIDRLNKKFAGDFLWVRHAGKEFLIRDHALISGAQRLFLPLDSLESEGAEIQEKQIQLEAEQATLDEEQKLIERKLETKSDRSDAHDLNPERDATERRLSDLKLKMTTLEVRADEIDAAQSAFESRSKAIEFEIEQALWRLVDQALLSGLGEDPKRE